MSWTDERVEQLKKLWSEGRSASWIADQIGGISRNAVIGKVHRLGLSGRVKATTPPPARVAAATPPGRGRGQPVKAPSAAPAPVTQTRMIVHGNNALQLAEDAAPVMMRAPDPDVVVPISPRVTLVELREQMCRWPLGDPTTPEFRFCGGKSPVGAPYCTHHARLAYQPAQERRREPRH